MSARPRVNRPDDPGRGHLSGRRGAIVTDRPIEATDQMVAVEGRDDEKAMLKLVRAAKELARVLIIVEGATPDRARAFAFERAARGIPDGDHWALDFMRSVLCRQVAEAVYLATLELSPES